MLYLALVNTEKYPGVQKKTEQLGEVLKTSPERNNVFFYNPRKFLDILNLLWCLLRAPEQILLRGHLLLSIPIGIFVTIRRITLRKTILEIPTPIYVIVNEILENKSTNFFIRYFKATLLYISHPISLLPFNRIIQYEPESYYFGMFVRCKTKVVSNGISVKNFPVATLSKTLGKDRITFVGVASLAEWHGYDRLLRGMTDYLSTKRQNEIDLRFIIVGDGDYRTILEGLVADLKLQKYVEFRGFAHGKDLDLIFEEANLGVSSLGLYRKNLDSASDLKSREYSARGLPFISAGSDRDFVCPTSKCFRLEFPNNNENIDIRKIIVWYSHIPSNMSIRDFSFKNLDWHVKKQSYQI
jgi:hypothetical protein